MTYPTSFVHVAFVLLVSLAGCQSTLPPMLSQPRELAADGPYVHRLSRFAFPPTVKGFARLQVLQYDAAGETVSVAYEAADTACPVTATVTLYVAPTHLPLLPPDAVAAEGRAVLVEEHFRTLTRSLLQTRRNATVLREEETTVFQAGGAHKARRGLFEYDEGPSGGNQRLRTDLYLFISGKWALKYRFVYPAESETCAAPAVDEFLLTLAWPRT